jgi:hypothetical protein
VLSILSVLCGRGRLPINRYDRNVGRIPGTRILRMGQQAFVRCIRFFGSKAAQKSVASLVSVLVQIDAATQSRPFTRLSWFSEPYSFLQPCAGRLRQIISPLL